VRMTKAKAVAAAIGATATAIATAITAASSFDKLDAASIAGLVTIAFTLVGTIYAVWKTENKPLGR
jgi:hypothetical protein